MKSELAAFFDRVRIKPRREGESRTTIGVDVEAELATPYDVVLAPGFAQSVAIETEEIRRMAAREKESGPEGPLSVISSPVTPVVSMLKDMAEGVGFEPTNALRRQQFSRLSRSTTPAPLRGPAGQRS